MLLVDCVAAEEVLLVAEQADLFCETVYCNPRDGVYSKVEPPDVVKVEPPDIVT